MKLIPEDNFDQNSTGHISFYLVNDEPPYSPIPGSHLTSASLKLFNKSSGVIINERGDVDVINSVDENGLFKFFLTEEDNPIIDNNALKEEIHVAQIEFKTSAGGIDKTLIVDYYITVDRICQSI